MNKRYNSIIHGYTKSAPKRVKAKQAKQLARQTSLPLGGRSAREVAHLREIELDENRWQNREAETVHKCGEGNASDGARAAVKIDAKSSRNQQGEYDQGGNCIP